jgi:hypothetical protein
VKKTEKDGKTEVKSKTHAGGGNDRQDAYLYGHPAGRRKRFRSPADFFPHLLWLCTDESGDPDNCGCKICSPEDLEYAIPGAQTKTEKQIKTEPDGKPFINQNGPPTARQPSVQSMGVAQQSSSLPGRSASSKPLLPTPLPQRKSPDQIIDSQYHTFMYRPGELAWFKRGQAWGLGVVTRRWYIQSGHQYHYTVQPLSHPCEQSPPVSKSSDVEMRPWLAWSVPPYTHAGLNNLPDPPRYETADWQGIRDGRYGTGDPQVDASILAAKAIDSTYTPFGLNSTTQPEPAVEVKHYDGIFLGAEKIWAGDPVRLFIGSGTDIMVVHDVVERKRMSANGQQVLQQSCHLVGDVYMLATVTHSNPALPTPAAPNDNPHLPQRLTEDLANRNAGSIQARRLASYWKLMSTQQTIQIHDIKGRWYEASILLPLLQQHAYEESARKGEVQEASLWMNSRGDCLNSNRPPNLPKVPKINIRKETRREALGRAVPPETQIVDGVQPPPPENVDPSLEDAVGGDTSEVVDIDPRFKTADAGAGEQPGGDQSVGLDDFMNLDAGLDGQDSMPGFGQEYASQPSQGGYF